MKSGRWAAAGIGAVAFISGGAFEQAYPELPEAGGLDDCVIGAQRAFAGKWLANSQRRVAADSFQLDLSQQYEINRWLDPVRLELNFYESLTDESPRQTIVEDLRPEGLDLIVTAPEGMDSFTLPVGFACHYDDSTETYRMAMDYTRDADGPDPFFNWIEIGPQAYLLQRFRRTDENTLVWMSAQAGRKLTNDAPPDEAQIRQVLADQQAAWNAGDINGFMDGYWQSGDLRFASGGDVTSGWQATLDRYLIRYDSREKMGVLTFSELDVDLLAPEAAIVFGRWELARPEAGDASGLFTLVFRKIAGRWVVVHDHTSAGE